MRIRIGKVLNAVTCTIFSALVVHSAVAQSGKFDGDNFESSAVIRIKQGKPLVLYDIPFEPDFGRATIRHDKVIHSDSFIDSCFSEHATLAKTPTFQGMTQEEAIELISNNLRVELDAEEPELVRLHFWAGNSLDTKRVLLAIIYSYRKLLYKTTKSRLAEQVDLLRDIQVKIDKKGNELAERINALKDQLEGNLIRQDSLRILLQELHGSEAKLAQKVRLNKLIQDCISSKDEEKIEITRRMLLELGELSNNPSQIPAQMQLEVAELKLSYEIEYLKERLTSIREQIREHEEQASKQSRLELYLSRQKRLLDAMDQTALVAARSLQQLEYLGFREHYQFEVIAPATDGVPVDPDNE